MLENAPTSKVLIDTNLWIYALDEDSQFYDKVQALLFASASDLFTTSKNLAEFLVVVTRGDDPALSIDEALSALQDIAEICTILHSNRLTLHIFQQLLAKHKPRGLKIHDFEIASIGLGYGINRIATVNTKDFAGIDEVEIVPL